MLKFVNTDVVFQEIPDEVSLAINISNCPCRCPGCHSKFLWADKGEPLDHEALDSMLEEFGNEISCISFMGGDAAPEEVNALASYLRETVPAMKIAWYSGRTVLSSAIDRANFDYVKVGPYIKHLGPLNSKTTNQHMYKVDHENQQLVDITYRFWSK